MCYFIQISETPSDDEFAALLHDIHSNNINGHGYRGYSLLGKSISEVTVSYFVINITLIIEFYLFI